MVAPVFVAALSSAPKALVGGKQRSPATPALRLYIRFGKWIEQVANRSRANQLRFERLWRQFFPFSEIYAELVVNKTGSFDPRIHCT